MNIDKFEIKPLKWHACNNGFEAITVNQGCYVLRKRPEDRRYMVTLHDDTEQSPYNMAFADTLAEAKQIAEKAHLDTLLHIARTWINSNI